MISSLRQKLLHFINSDKETPLLAGLAAGLYPILFYYGNNYGMANSLMHLLFFACFFILLPTLLLLLLRKLFSFGPLKVFHKYILPAFSVFTFLILLLFCIYAVISKKMLLGTLIATDFFVLAFWKHYKKLILLQLLLALIGFLQLLPNIYTHLTSSGQWTQLLPEEQGIVFTKKPNIYMIQPDGYVNFSELKKGYYNYDNTNFEQWLSRQGFSLHHNFRSNYYSTLSSNSSLFAMKHHYYKNTISERQDIVGKNNALSILKSNGYTTFLLLEKEYIIANKPRLYYDFCNISNSEVAFTGTALKIQKNVIPVLKTKMQEHKTGPNFFFIEQLLPSHVHVYQKNSLGIEGEKQAYLNRLEKANIWLKTIIGAIQKADPDALIIMISDHGGFVGMGATSESDIKTQDRNMIYSVFSTGLAVKWPQDYDHSLDKELGSSVNFFRVLFSYLSDSQTLLQHKEEDASYIPLQRNTTPGIYKYITADGFVQCERLD